MIVGHLPGGHRELLHTVAKDGVEICFLALAVSCQSLLLLPKVPARQGMESLSELELRAAKLRSEAALLRSQLRAARAKQSRKSAADTWGACAPWMKAVAVRMLAVVAGGVGPSLRYLKSKIRSASEADVRGWFTWWPAEAQAQLLHPSPEDTPALRHLAEARKLAEQLQLVSWVEGQNVNEGLGPTSTLVSERPAPGLAKSSEAENRLRWVRRCTGRLSGHRGRIVDGQRLSQEDFRQKVGPALQLLLVFLHGRARN